MNAPAEGPKRLVLVGASGMVGGYALRCALEDPAVESVMAVGRKKLGISHPQSAVYPAFRLLFPNQVIRADDMARVMVDAVVRGTQWRTGPIFENRDIRAIAGSLHPPKR